MIASKTVPYRSFNEDKIIITDNLYMILDGATVLAANNYMNDFSDAYWLVNFVEKKLLECKTTDILATLNKISQAGYDEYRNKSGGNLEAMPTCTMCFAVINKETVDLYVIGDAEITYINKDKTIHRFADFRLSSVDDKSLKAITEYAFEAGISFKDAINERLDVLKEARKMANKKEGYGVFTINENPSFSFLHQTIKKDNLDSIYLYSDGFAQYFTTLKITDHQNLFKSDINIAGSIKLIKKKWHSDPDLTRYPRFKKEDDISIIKIKELFIS